MIPVPQQYANAAQQHQAGNLAEAARLYRLVLQAEPNHADALHLLGILLSQQNQHAEAISLLGQAVSLVQANPVFQNNLGEAHYRAGDFASASGCYRAALKLQPGFFQARFHLGNALKGLGDVPAALEAYRQAVAQNPRFAKAHYNLANTLREEGYFSEAISHYKQSASLQPNHVETFINLGHAYRESQQIGAALDSYRHALTLAPDRSEVHGDIAALLYQHGQVPEAIAHYKREIAIRPSWLHQFRLESLCPLVPQSNQEIDDYRERLSRTLDAALEHRPRFDLKDLHAAGVEPPFPLAYQGRDDLPLKVKHARIFRDCFPRGEAKLNSGAPRVGFVVTRGHEGVFMKCMRGLLEHIDATQFHTAVVCTAFTRNYLRQHIRNPAVQYVVIENQLDQAAETIRAARFDVLLYWEVGTDSLNYFLPFYRLAPVQCTMFGWPITTGIPRMDYFVSSEYLETPEADAHYTERLFRLQTLPTCYYRPARVSASHGRERFGVDERSHLYFSGQRVRKFHPDFDPLLGDILRADPQGVFVLISDAQPEVTRLLTNRLERTLPDVFDRVRVVEWLSEADYQNLNALADVVLDTLHYGGGANTLCDAFAAAKPIVTLPGPFQRSRYCAAAYARMGLAGCVAGSPRDYVDQAVRLGTDRDFRQEMTRQIAAANSVLFEDLTAVREYERFFREAIAQVRGAVE